MLEMRRARRRRALATELLGELGVATSGFSLRAKLADDPEAVSRRARNWLGVDIEDQKAWRTERVALRAWISALEAAGVLVFQTSGVELAEMRGFSLSETSLPVIVLNTKDVPAGRIFTLMHEFTHLMLNRGGICDPTQVSGRRAQPDDRTEVFCNHVAGGILVPGEALLNDPAIDNAAGATEWDDTILRKLAAKFSVSREVIVRRLLILGRVSEAYYQRKRRQYQGQFDARAPEAPERRGHPPLSILTVRDHGPRYTRLVLQALDRSHITEADIPDYLGVRLKHLDEIADAVEEPAVEM
jgi:Zn-dependent peptidase ImmA (M78 family)